MWRLQKKNRKMCLPLWKEIEWTGLKSKDPLHVIDLEVLWKDIKDQVAEPFTFIILASAQSQSNTMRLVALVNGLLRISHTLFRLCPLLFRRILGEVHHVAWADRPTRGLPQAGRPCRAQRCPKRAQMERETWWNNWNIFKLLCQTCHTVTSALVWGDFIRLRVRAGLWGDLGTAGGGHREDLGAQRPRHHLLEERAKN